MNSPSVELLFAFCLAKGCNKCLHSSKVHACIKCTIVYCTWNLCFVCMWCGSRLYTQMRPMLEGMLTLIEMPVMSTSVCPDVPPGYRGNQLQMSQNVCQIQQQSACQEWDLTGFMIRSWWAPSPRRTLSIAVLSVPFSQTWTRTNKSTSVPSYTCQDCSGTDSQGFNGDMSSTFWNTNTR